jgi:hypothetical protein
MGKILPGRSAISADVALASPVFSALEFSTDGHDAADEKEKGGARPGLCRHSCHSPMVSIGPKGYWNSFSTIDGA